MAKRRGSKPHRHTTRQPQRDATPITKSSKGLLRSKIYRFERDERRFRPSIFHSALLDDGRPAGTHMEVQYTGRMADKDVPLREAMYFDEPLRVTVCKRRKERREILFRLQKLGRGKGVRRLRRRNAYSDVICR